MRPSLTVAALVSVALAATIEAPPYRTSLIDLHKALVTTPSVSGNENNVGNFLVDYLTERGYVVATQHVEPLEGVPGTGPRFNVVAWKGENLNRPRVMVTSHIDVVPPHIEYGIDDGDITQDTMITGRGTVDGKGSVASMIIAANNLLATGSVGDEDIMLLFVVGEEISGDGMRAFSRAASKSTDLPVFSAAIFGEPTENKLACGHKGGLFCQLTAYGKAGHSSYPWLGKSANEVTIKALAKIMETDLGSSETYGNTTVNIGRFDGGVASNVIAEKTNVGMMIRVAIGPEKVGAELVRKRMLAVLNEVDDEAFELDCPKGYGFVESNCDVQGMALHPFAFLRGYLSSFTAGLTSCRFRDNCRQLRNGYPQPRWRLYSLPLRTRHHICGPWRKREHYCW
jgi:acetylornithine deacetylase